MHKGPKKRNEKDRKDGEREKIGKKRTRRVGKTTRREKKKGKKRNEKGRKDGEREKKEKKKGTRRIGKTAKRKKKKIRMGRIGKAAIK